MTLKQLDQFWQNIKEKDRKTFGEFYELFYPSLIGRALKFIKDQEACKEIVQDTFTLFWKKANTITPEKHFMEAYLWQILRSQISKYYRSKKEKNIYLEEFDRTDAMAVNQVPFTLNTNDLESIINNAIAALPKKSRDIFIMSRINGLTYTEISEEFNVSVKTVEYHMSNALKKLRKSLKPYL